MPISNSLLSLGARLGRSDPVRKLTYAIRNRVTFDDLYQHDRMLADTVRMDAYQPRSPNTSAQATSSSISGQGPESWPSWQHAVEHGGCTP